MGDGALQLIRELEAIRRSTLELGEIVQELARHVSALRADVDILIGHQQSITTRTSDLEVKLTPTPRPVKDATIYDGWGEDEY